MTETAVRVNSAARIVDVNLNRLTEALKLTEDICRFSLADAALTRDVRVLRAELDRTVLPLRRAVLPYRGSRADAGRAAGFDRGKRADTAAVLSASLKRAQEACRILEEFTKVTSPSTAPVFKAARFRCYDIEQDAIAHLARHLDLRLYVILDTATVGRQRLAGLAREVAAGGASVIQLREPKDLPTHQYVADARQMRAAVTGESVRFIVNDRVDVALAADADGVHLGQDDMPLKVARRLMPTDRIIGLSVRTAAEARQAEKDGADYLGAGAVFPTPSKPDAAVIGLSRLHAIRRASRLPLVAIGGINLENAREAVRAGADGIAVISAAFGAGSIRANLKRLSASLIR